MMEPPAKKPRRDKDDGPFAALLAWAKAGGCAGLDNITIRRGDHDTLGAGLYAANNIPAGGTVITLPQPAVLTLGRAASSALGLLARSSACEWGTAAAAACTDARRSLQLHAAKSALQIVGCVF